MFDWHFNLTHKESGWLIRVGLNFRKQKINNGLKMNTNAAPNNPREAKTKKLSSGTKNTPTADTATAKPKKPKRVRRRREKKKPQEQPPPPADAIPDAGTRAVSKEKPPPLVPNPPPQLKQPQIIKIETAVKSPVSPSGLSSPTTKSVVVSVLNGTNVVTKNNGIVKPTTSEKPKNGLPELISENNFEIELEKNYVFRRRKVTVTDFYIF